MANIYFICRHTIKYCLCIFLVLYLSSTQLANAETIVNLFIPSDYLADSTVAAFDKMCNCHLSQTFFNEPAEMLAKMAAGASGYNVIEATSYAVEELQHMGKLQPLDKSRLPNLKYIKPQFLNQPYDPNNKYSIPYAYTPVFLAYNTDKLRALGITPNSWAVIFEPKYLKKLRGHITVFASARNVFAAALLFLGKDPNSSNINDLNAARVIIDRAAGYWAKFDSDSYYRGLLRGDIWIAMSYSDDIYKAMQDAQSSHLAVHIGANMQKEGNMYELDNLVIPINSPNTNLAYMFLNLTLAPQSAYELAVMTGSSIANQVALDKLPVALKNLDWAYPKNMSIQHTFTAYDPKTRQLVNEMWTEIQMQCHSSCN
jgi:spermidine/putrescine transport system substrate-binding protein